MINVKYHGNVLERKNTVPKILPPPCGNFIDARVGSQYELNAVLNTPTYKT
jgi:hypothetical protein